MNKREINLDMIGIGKRLRQVRKTLDLKQAKLAEILSITVVTLSDIETGKKKPSIDVLFILSEALRVNPLFLLHGEGDMFRRENHVKGVILEDGIFGDYTDDFKEILWYMQNSRLARAAIIVMGKEYCFRNQDLLKMDIKKQEEKNLNIKEKQSEK